jgi:hypothetical protein
MALARALLLVGVWLGLLFASWAVATANFRTVDRVLGPALRPELQARLAPLPPEDRRAAFRHLASEVNRWIFRWWSPAQAVLAALLLGLCWSMGGSPRALLLAAAGVVLAQWALAGAIVELGRSIDFVPRPLSAEIGRRFGLLHAGYVSLDLAKAVLLLAAGHLLARRLG